MRYHQVFCHLTITGLGGTALTPLAASPSEGWSNTTGAIASIAGLVVYFLYGSYKQGQMRE